MRGIRVLRFTGRARSERGQILVISVVMMFVVIAIAAIVIDLGSFFEHRRHLQTQVDAAALAAGGKWAVPCGPDTSAGIEAEARKYVGAHTQASGVPYSGPTNNSQIGGTSATDIHVVLNGGFWTDSAAPADFSGDTPGVASGDVCAAKAIDVKATENNVHKFFAPWAPDLRAQARVEIQQVEGLSGLLPIAVRVPKPRSAAAIFYNETNGRILAAAPFSPLLTCPSGKTLDQATSKCFTDANGNGVYDATPAPGDLICCSATVVHVPVTSGLGGWATASNGAAATFTMPGAGQGVGVVIALSYKPLCPSGGPVVLCFDTSAGPTVNDLCRQQSGTLVQCFYGTGTGATQSVNSGLIFIRSYKTPTKVSGNGAPALNSVYLSPDTCTLSGSFNAIAGACTIGVNAEVDLGGAPARTAGNAEVIATGTNGTYTTTTTLKCPSGCAGVWKIQAAGLGPSIKELSNGFEFSFRVRLQAPALGTDFKVCPKNVAKDSDYNTLSGICEFRFAAPQQRTFMGGDDASGPIQFLSLTEVGAKGTPDAASSQKASTSHSFVVEMGLAGAIAQDQIEPPLAFNLKGSQSATLDCDPAEPNIKSEVQNGCSPFYAVNDLSTSPVCPGTSQFFNVPKSAPFDNWPPYRCVLTQTGNPTQLLSGFNLRVFNNANQASCDGSFADAARFVKGRNYWADANSPLSLGTFSFANSAATPPHGNNLGKNGAEDDPRLILLFMTPYDSFGGSGNATFPIISFGSFYVTGWGKGKPGGGITIEDPCPGFAPPPNLITESGGAYVWGHFIDNVTIAKNTGGNGVSCDPGTSFQPCVPVLVR